MEDPDMRKAVRFAVLSLLAAAACTSPTQRVATSPSRSSRTGPQPAAVAPYAPTPRPQVLLVPVHGEPGAPAASAPPAAVSSQPASTPAANPPLMTEAQRRELLLAAAIQPPPLPPPMDPPVR